MNRLTRDAILTRALDMLDSPSLDALDRPNGPIEPKALSIGWLQDALDLAHHEIPQAGIVKTATITLTGGSDTAPLPADFIKDLRHGLMLPAVNRRLLTWPLPKLLHARLSGRRPATPERYTVLPPNLRVWPTPDKTYEAELWYYALPSVLNASDVPNFPSDFVLVEYVRLRGMEWLGKLPPGSAAEYARAEMAKLRKRGLFHEPEDDQLALDPETFRPTGAAPWSWMGDPVA